MPDYCKNSHLFTETMQIIFARLVCRSTSPYTYNSIFASFGQISILDPYTLNSCWADAVHFRSISSATIPMAAVRLVVDFCDILPSRRHDPSCVEHHASNRIVVCVCIVYRSCPKVPYLLRVFVLLATTDN